MDHLATFSKNTLNCDSKSFAEFSELLLSMGHRMRFTATGGSMRPLIRQGDTLTVEPVVDTDIRIGDVILFTNSRGQAVVHRVIRILDKDNHPLFLLKGDHADRDDGFIPFQQVLGRVAELERGALHFKMDQVGLKMMGQMAVYYSRLQTRQNWLASGLYHLLKKMPGFRQYLS